MDTKTERAVAVLHNFIEGTAYDVYDIADELGWEVRGAVDAVTKPDGEAHEDLIEHVAANSIRIQRVMTIYARE